MVTTLPFLEHMHRPYTVDDILSFLQEELTVCGTRYLTMEGFPLRMHSSRESSFVDWKSRAFQHSWDILTTIYQTLSTQNPRVTFSHFVLLDDHLSTNGVLSLRSDSSSMTDNDFFAQTLTAITSAFHQPPAIFSHIDAWTLESTIHVEKKAASCSERDMFFQWGKYTHFLNRVQPLPSIIHLVIHPVTYMQQQLDMLQRLYTFMGQQQEYPMLKNLAKRDRRIFSTCYRHIWIDQKGEIVGITKPSFAERLAHLPLYSSLRVCS